MESEQKKFKRGNFYILSTGVENLQSETMSGMNNPTNNTVWSQIPPTSMPWGITNENFPQVVRFTGSDNNSTFPFGSPSDRSKSESDLKIKSWLTKRKGFFETEMLPPAKIHITEEHMASQLQSMHISTMYTSHLKEDSFNTVNRNERIRDLGQNNYSDTFISTSDRSDLVFPSLVMCDELRRLQTPNILPPSLVANLDNPSKALVLWKPPSEILLQNNSESKKDSEKQIHDKKNNNNDELASESNSGHQIAGHSSVQQGSEMSPCSVICGLSSFDNSSDDIEDMSIDM
ncbi:uncharacterized protein LOC142322835 [Lycorma delicatula]|uniref:uncharacterized protein LOC142322835 n=1 Tax=Lycorma delicatula TaxID=130591 RepID=UPI003F50D8BB